MKMTMRKMLAILATLAILCTVLPLGTMFSAVADGNNLLVNGDFESGSEGWELGSSASIISDDVHGGSGALKIQNPGQWAGAAVQTIAVDANSDYTIKMWVKRVEGTKAFNLYVMNGDTNANLKVVEGQNWFNTADADWTEKTMVVNTADATSMTVKWSSETTEAGIILIDDMTVTKVDGGETPDEPVNPNIIKNGDFASDISGWSASGGTVLAYDDGALHADFNEAWGFINAGTYSLKANTSYKLTFKAKSINGGVVTPKMNKADWSGTVVEQGMSFTGEWADYEWTFTTTDITSLMLFFQSGHPAGDGQEIWLDDVVLVEATGDEPEAPAEPSNDGYIVNGDFETGELAPWDNLWGSCPTAEVIEGGKDSKYAVNIVSGQWLHVRQANIAVEANTDYKITVWAKNTKDMSLLVKDGGDSKDLKNAGVNAGAEWTQFTAEFNTGDYTTIIFSLMGSSADAYGTFDNIVMEKVGGGEPETPDEPEDLVTVFHKDFEDGTNGGFERSVNENGYIVFDATTADWQNTYTYVNALKANTDYVVTFKAKANKATNMNFKVNDNWGGDAAAETVDVTTEWQEYELNINMASLSTGIVMFSSNSKAADAATYYIDDVKIAEKKAPVTPDEPDEPDVPDEPTVDPSFDGYLYNGDFETGVLADDWTLATKGLSGIFAEAAKDGKYGMKLEGNAYEEILTSPVIALKKGVTYTISFDIKLINMGEINFQIKNCYEDNASKGGNILVEYIRDASVDTWKHYTYTFKNEDLARDYASLLFVNHANTDFYVDNIVITSDDEPEVPSGDALNENFDDGEMGALTSSSDVSVEDGTLKFNVNKDYGMVYSELKLEPNTDYEVSFKAKSLKSKSLWVKFNKGWASDVASATVNLTADWKDYSVTLNSGDNDTLLLLLQYAGSAGDGECIWFDDVVVKKAGGADPEPPASSDLLINGGFENGTEGWEMSSSATIVDDAHTGKGALQLTDVGMWAAAAVQTVPVEPNTKYVVNLWYKREVGQKAFNLFIMNGETNANLSVDGQIWFNDAPGDWTERTLIVDTGDATSMTLKWSAEAANDGVLLVDDMQVYPEGQEPDAPVSDNPIQNSGFETGKLDPATIPGSVAGAWYNVWGSCAVTFEEPGYDGSKYALNLEIEGKWSHTRQDKIPVKPNTDYVVWAYVKNTTGMSIVIKDGDDTTGITNDEHGAIPEDMTNTWKLHKVEFNSGSYDSVCVLLIAIADNGGVGTFDDVLLYEKGKEPTAGETGPVKDAGFETGKLDPGTMPGTVIGAWYNVWGACTYTFETPGHDKSQYAISIEAPGSWQQIRQDGIPVEPNTDYTVVAYVKNPVNFNLVVKTADDTTNIADYGIANDTSNAWIRLEVPFNSGEETSVCLLLIGNDQGPSSALFDNVQIYKKGEEPAEPEPDAPPTEGPLFLDSYGVNNNRPVTPEANLILNGSFEDAEGGQWQSILGDVITIVDDETAPSGNKSLYFNTSGVEYDDKAVFYIDVEPDTDYVFSAWVKGAFISDTNRFKATFGVIDYKNRFAVYEDHVFSNKDRQIVPPCWDNEWHLRSVSFNSGVNVKVGIAITGGMSQMWLDDIALFKMDDGIKYADSRQVSYIIASPLYAEEGGCEEENSLIPDINMDDAEAEEFWSSAEGYKNGFLSFAENKYEYGTSLKYTASDKAVGTYAIKWLDVKPNTTYTYSVDLRIVEGGAGKLVLLDGKIRECYPFLMVDFDKDTYGGDWFTVAIEFNTGEFDRIGIAVADGGGEALIDNMRLFESTYRAEVEDNYVEPPYGFDEPVEPDSPNTGVSVMGAVLAMALVPSSALVAFKLRRKKEDEE